MLTNHQRAAIHRAIELSRKHPDDAYYVMRDECYAVYEREAWFVRSGSSRDRHGDTPGCEAWAAFCDGQRLPDYD